MLRYWAIAPTDYSDRGAFEKIWQFDRDHDVIAIGWDVGEPQSREDLEKKYARASEEEGWTQHGLNMLKKFWFDIRPGDRVIARAGRKRIVGIGTVRGEPYFDPESGQSNEGANLLSVQWDDVEEREFERMVFGMHTIYELSEPRFEELVGGTLETAGGREGLSALIQEETGVLPSEQDSQLQKEFVMEKYLEEFIVSNFEAVFGDEIRVYRDEDGNDGQQYLTDVGVIDILAREAAGDSYVVIELKKGKTSDAVVGQVLRYMGWVKEQLCLEAQGVRGIIVCGDQDEKLDYALSMVKDVEAMLYRVDFQLYPHRRTS